MNVLACLDKHGNPLCVGDDIKILTDKGFFVFGKVLSVKGELAKVDLLKTAPEVGIKINPVIIELPANRLEKVIDSLPDSKTLV